MSRPLSKRSPLIAGVLVAGLAAGVLGSSGARAAFIGCRSDPKVILSNGVVLDLSATIADDVTDIQQITYVLQVPQGVSLLHAISTDGVVGYHEQFQFQAGGKAGPVAATYQVQVNVQTRTKSIGVTAMITGGDAAVLGITPAMVSPGATSFSPVDANDAQSKPTKGPSAPSVLPSTVTDGLNVWAQSAAWAASAAIAGVTGKPLLAAISL